VTGCDGGAAGRGSILVEKSVTYFVNDPYDGGNLGRVATLHRAAHSPLETHSLLFLFHVLSSFASDFLQTLLPHRDV